MVTAGPIIPTVISIQSVIVITLAKEKTSDLGVRFLTVSQVIDLMYSGGA